MIAPREIIVVETSKAVCCGDTALPHPRVFLAIGAAEYVDCPYCGKRYISKSFGRLPASAGIAIGPILFVLAMLALLGSVIASGGGDFQIASGADRITADIVSQANLIRNTISECNMRYMLGISNNSVAPASSPYPETPTGNLVSGLECSPMGTGSLWGAILLPPPTRGFNAWSYVDAGDAGGRCIWTTPSTSNPKNVQSIVVGLTRAAAKFNTAAAYSATAEALYDPASTSQKFVLWITMPSGSANSNCLP